MKISAPSDLHNNHKTAPICGVVATAVCTGLPIAQVYRDYARNYRGNWKGILPLGEILHGIRNYGVELKHAKDLDAYGQNRATLKSFIQRTMITEPESVFLIFTTGHVQVVQGRNVIDQAGMVDFMNYRWNRKKIDYHIYRVNSNNAVIRSVNKQEIELMTTNRETKFTRATRIVADLLAKGVKRKDILAQLTTDLDTSWGSASTFYHRVIRDIKQKENA